MNSNIKSGMVCILEIKSSATYQKGGTKQSVNYQLATVTSAAGCGVVRIAGNSYDQNLRSMLRTTAIALSNNLQETAVKVVTGMVEPIEFETIEQCRGYVAQAYKPEPYKAKYDRKGRLVPGNPILRNEIAAHNRKLTADDGVSAETWNRCAAIQYANWLAQRDGIAIEPASKACVVWDYAKVDLASEKRARAVEYHIAGIVRHTIEIPNWDFVPAYVFEEQVSDTDSLPLAA